MKKCDIIIPIYNAFDCLKPCIDSVIENTDLSENNLILIDDKSPDGRVIPLLEEYAKKDGITFLKNEKNQGFVKTVNIGMRLSKENDVLLLNSDTEVTPDWLDKIKKCAYSRKDIATVTPLSNNATIASVPHCFMPNDLPEGYDLKSFSKLVEDASYLDYPEVPTGHGFCLYIKRSALDRVGFFDEESFGKGYGEENDFCFRCLDCGLTNVICDNTYIYHKESQSFAESKTKEIEQGLNLLARRYSYIDVLNEWIAKKDIAYLGENIQLSMGTKNNTKPNILFVIHDFNDIENNIGGTSLHAYDIIRQLNQYFNFHVLYPQEGVFKVTSYWSENKAVSTVTYPYFGGFTKYGFYNAEYAKFIGKIFNIYNIGTVHIHHILHQYFDLIDVAKANGISVVTTLHDYYFACPRINKIYQNSVYCGNGSTDMCKTCLLGDFETSARTLHFVNSWRENCHEELKKCDLLIAPSAAAKEEMLKTYSDLDIKVIEHGIDLKRETAIERTDSNKLNVAFIGAIGIHKGSNILRTMAKNKKNIKVHLFGFADTKIPSAKNFTDHGKYTREELTGLIKKNSIDIICLFSIWPETYSYTLTEAIACGVPVIAYDFGAIGERIKKYNLGYLVPQDADCGEIIKTLINIKNDIATYNEKVKSINEYQIKTTAQMAGEYKEIYSGFLSGKDGTVNGEVIKDNIKNVLNITASSQDYAFEIMSSLKWRIVSKIRFPKFIGRFIRRLHK